MNSLPTVALSIRQPWAWLVAAGHKTTENRTRRTHFRGPVLIHAGKTEDITEWLSAFATAKEIDPGLISAMPTEQSSEIRYGGIIGIAEIVACELTSSDPWHRPGAYGWAIANARLLPFHPCKGALGFFKTLYPSAGHLAAADAGPNPT